MLFVLGLCVVLVGFVVTVKVAVGLTAWFGFVVDLLLVVLVVVGA